MSAPDQDPAGPSPTAAPPWQPAGNDDVADELPPSLPRSSRRQVGSFSDTESPYLLMA